MGKLMRIYRKYNLLLFVLTIPLLLSCAINSYTMLSTGIINLLNVIYVIRPVFRVCGNTYCMLFTFVTSYTEPSRL